ncbi:MAG: rRNA maturation RNase YbeY [Pseudomonadota bacterium]
MAIVDLLIEHPGWRAALPEIDDVAEQAAAMALNVLRDSDRPFEICIMACDDERIAALNGEFREKPLPTNVLSWPAFDLAPSTPGGVPEEPPTSMVAGQPVFLGDVAISLQTLEREADAASRPLKSHVMHLILHGCLHLLGFDHETPEDAGRMEALETCTMITAGYGDPYA